MSKAKAFGKRAVRQAVVATVEHLEQRALFAAGQLDWSLFDPNSNGGDPTGYSGYNGYELEASPDAGLTYEAFNAKAVKAPDYALYMGGIDVRQGFDNRMVKVLVDNAGKTVVVGMNTSIIGWQVDYTVTKFLYTDPATGKTAPVSAQRYYYGDVYYDSIYVARYNIDGSLDCSTGTNTDKTASLGDQYGFNGGPIEDLGTLKTVASQQTTNCSEHYDEMVTKMTAAGTFAKLVKDLDIQAITAAIDPTDNSVVVIAQQFDGPFNLPGTYWMMRYANVYLGNTLPPQVTMTKLATAPGHVTDMKMMSDGSFVLVGNTDSLAPVTGVDMEAARFDRNGVLLNRYNPPAFTLNSYESIEGVDTDSLNRVYMVGLTDDTTWNPTSGYSHLVLLRYSQTGQLDATFGFNAQAQLADFGNKNVAGIDIKVQADNKVIVMGQLDMVPDSSGIMDTTVVARFNTDGTLDSTFIGGGRAYIRGANANWIGKEVVIQSDGGLVVSGVANGTNVEAVRLNKSGRIDTTFGGPDAADPTRSAGFAQIPTAANINAIAEPSTSPWVPSMVVCPTFPKDATLDLEKDKVIFGINYQTQAGDHSLTASYPTLVDLGARWTAGEWNQRAVILTDPATNTSATRTVVAMAQTPAGRAGDYFDTLILDSSPGFTIDSTTKYDFVVGPTNITQTFKAMYVGNHGWGAQWVGGIVHIVSGTGAGSNVFIRGMAQTAAGFAGDYYDILLLDGSAPFVPDSTTTFSIFMPVVDASGSGTADINSTSTSLEDSTQKWTQTQYKNGLVNIQAGTGAGVIALITSMGKSVATNTTYDTLNFADIGTVLDDTSKYQIYTNQTGATLITATGGGFGVTGANLTAANLVQWVGANAIISKGALTENYTVADEATFATQYDTLIFKANPGPLVATTSQLTVDLSRTATGAGQALLDGSQAASHQWTTGTEMIGTPITMTSGTDAGLSFMVVGMAKSDPLIGYYDLLILGAPNANIVAGDTFSIPGEGVNGNMFGRLLTTNKAPISVAQTPDVYETSNTYTFLVTFSDDELVDVASLLGKNGGFLGTGVGYRTNAVSIFDASGVQVNVPITVMQLDYMNTGPYGSFPVDHNGDGYPDGKKMSVTYVADLSSLPGGSFKNGTYTVRLSEDPAHLGSSFIYDTNQTVTGANAPLAEAAGVVNTFLVNIDNPDLDGPTVSFNYPVGTATINDITAGMTVMGQAYWDFHVVYSDATGVDINTIKSGNLQVTGPYGYKQSASLVGSPVLINGTSNYLVTYRILAPNAASATDYAHPWNPTYNGQYTVSMLPNQVQDVSPYANYAAGGQLGVFNVSLRTDVTVYPTAAITTPTAGYPAGTMASITAVQGTGYFFNVDYVASSYGSVIDPSTIDANGSAIQILGPGGVLVPVTYVSKTGIAGGYRATYSALPAGGWGYGINGGYTIQMVAQKVGDVNAPKNYVQAGDLGVFNVAIYDTIVPTATLAAVPPINTINSSPVDFTVTYNDDVAVAIASISAGNVMLQAPDGITMYALVLTGVNPSSNSLSIVATYRLVTPPGGTWLGSANGIYTIVMAANQVLDTSSNAVVAGPLGTMTVNVPPDTIAPTATVSSAPAIVTAGSATYDFILSFDDNVAINVATLGDGNVVVTPPAGADLNATFVSVDYNTNGTPRLARYRINAPLGAWQGLSNGIYTIKTVANQVGDVSGNYAMAGAVGTFQVAIPLAPVSAALTPVIPPSGVTPVSLVVTYTCTDLMRASTLINNNGVVMVTGPNGYSMPAAYVSIDSPTKGSPRVVTYLLTAPAGGWEANGSGNYTVTIVSPNGVQSVQGATLPAATLGTFGIDVSAPTVAIANTPAVIPGLATYDFVLRFTDNTAVDVATLGDSNITVLTPGGAVLPASFVSVDIASNGTPRQATYRITSPSGIWQGLDNGTYTINIVANQVADVHANYAAAGVVGTFQVAIAVAPVTAAFGTQLTTSPTGSAALSFTVTFACPTDGLKVSTLIGNNSLITVTGPNGFSAPATYVSIDNATNGSPRTVTYQVNAPAGGWAPINNGKYTVVINTPNTVQSGQNGILAGTSFANVMTIAIDAAGPVPTMPVPPADILTKGVSGVDVTIIYTDATSVLGSTISSADVVLVPPSGGSPLVGNLVSATPAGNATPVTAIYHFGAPNGTFMTADNGTYTVRVVGGEVGDVYFNATPQTDVGTFKVNVDTIAPTATLAPVATITAKTASTVSVIVSYTDTSKVSAASLNPADVILVTPSGGTMTASQAVLNPTGDAATISVTYTFNAPGTYFTAYDNGTYTVHVQAGEVSDTNANFMAGTDLGTFQVAIVALPLTASLSVPVSTPTPGSAASTILVRFDCADGVSQASVDVDNLVRVTGPNSFGAYATYIPGSDAVVNGSLVVGYSIAAPGGSWDYTASGTYSIAIGAPNSARSTQGATLGATSLGTFNVVISPAQLVGSTITIAGTGRSDMIEVLLLNDTTIRALVNNSSSDFSRDVVSRILIYTYGGNDTIKLDDPIVGTGITGTLPGATVFGGDGNDSIYGSSANDTLYGEGGDDYIDAGAGNDVVYGGAGNDMVAGGAGNDIIYGGSESDQLHGGSGDDRVYGGKGADTLWGDKGSNYLDGQQGNDVIYARNGTLDAVVGGAGTDKAQVDTGLDLIPFNDVEQLLA